MPAARRRRTSHHEGPVKAILHSQYGAPDLLQLREVDKPAPRDNEVLIAIHATARVLGTELAGEVESTGKDVKKFKKGDRIVASTGMAAGGHAQYACLPEDGDLIFDIVGATRFRRCRHALKPRGIFLQNIMGLSGTVGILWTSIVGGKKLKGGVAMECPARMTVIAELVLAGKLRPVIDKSFPLERIAEAFRYVEQGHKKGNVVITVAHP